MKTIKACLGASVLVVSVTAQTVTFFPASAPVETTALTTWRANATSALENGATTWGIVGTPGYFDASNPVILASEVVSTPTFSSWHGYANPSSVFGENFAGQLGNSYRVPFIVMRGAAQFSLSQLSGSRVIGSNSGAIPSLTGNYLSSVIGIRFGSDGALGGGDDTYVTSGANTQLVDALIYNAYSTSFIVSSVGVTDQERLNKTFGSIASITYTTTIFFDGNQIGQHTQTFQPVTAIPEPWHYAALLGTACFSLVLTARPRLRKKCGAGRGATFGGA